MTITDNRDINLVGANAVSMQVKTMQNTLLSHVSNGPDSDDDAGGDGGMTPAPVVWFRAAVTLAYADLLYKQNSYLYSEVTARSNSLRMARRDVGLLWDALATCGLVVTGVFDVPVEKLTAKQRADREERLYRRGLLPASECRYFIAPKACDETEGINQ